VFTPVVAYLVYRERLSKLNIFGLIVSFLGVLFMLLERDYSLSVSPVGVAWLSLAVVTAVLYSVLLKKLAARYDAFFIVAVQNLIGVFYFLPLFFIFDFRHFITVQPTTELVTALLLLAVFASSLAFVFFTISSREIGISRTNLFTNLIPVFTAVFSFIILGEVFGMQKIVGMVVVITGVMMTQMNGKNKNNFANMYRFFVKGK
jgi:drug/metabolite transporter (DMT)-like permease